ncbi:MAG: hypothetical protein FWD23_13915, partial [Oscillospiraceae bacterium]|nr:hypothetical protein [Oscillospiraceae bacterium]
MRKKFKIKIIRRNKVMKIPTSKTKMAKRLKSLLLVLAMIVTMLPFGFMSVSAAPITNSSVADAVSATDPNTLAILLAGNQNVFGTVSVAELRANFPKFTYLTLNGTNVTDVVNPAGSGVTVDIDSIATPDIFGSYVPSTPNAAGANAAFAQGAGDLDFETLIREAVRIQSSNASLSPRAIPSGMFKLNAGKVTVWADATTSKTYNGSAGTSIPAADLVALGNGVYRVDLEFEMNFDNSPTTAGRLYMIDQIKLQIKTESYEIEPKLGGTVYDGGITNFVLRRKDADGKYIPLEALSSYEIELQVYGGGPIPGFDPNINMASDNMSMVISIAADPSNMQIGMSNTLVVFKKGNPRVELAQAEVIRAVNGELLSLQLVEYAGKDVRVPLGPPSSPFGSGTRIYVKGGTALSSAVSITQIDGYNMSTMYLLYGEDAFGSGYVSVNYEHQVKISYVPTDVEDDILVELVSVVRPNSVDPNDLILAIVVTA